jgi:hypothetical protein
MRGEGVRVRGGVHKLLVVNVYAGLHSFLLFSGSAQQNVSCGEEGYDAITI